MKIEHASDSVDKDEGSCGCLLPKRKEEMRGKMKAKRKGKKNKDSLLKGLMSHVSK